MSSTGPYGDPRTAERILQATWDLIDGSGSTPRLVDVADRAGVSRQTVYLHFGDRAGLLVALVRYMDQVLGLDEAAEQIREAPTGVEALERMVRALSVFAPRIYSVAHVLEAAQHQDEAVAAWRDRMRGRQAMTRVIFQRIADEGRLAAGWSVDTAAALSYTLTMPGPWRELTGELGWSPEMYAENIIKLLRRSLLSN
ncbi:MAG: TetR family transcriptional regulator [Nitriliruptorales bacterium]|nr:TetR family transcriptional regulator [Nitriliruptorales bacterium]